MIDLGEQAQENTFSETEEAEEVEETPQVDLYQMNQAPEEDMMSTPLKQDEVHSDLVDEEHQVALAANDQNVEIEHEETLRNSISDQAETQQDDQPETQ